ncbi:hypothetical protein [Haloferula sp.]|uniref:hypothetical protein n=1 Tax=Haloferula sp. TaxID=2497595 RepID=UPI003C794CBC
MRDHGEREARRIIRVGLRLAKIVPGELKSLPKGDWRKRVIGMMVRRHTTVKVGWVAEELAMGIPTRAGRLTSHSPTKGKWGSDWKAAAKLLKELERDYRKAENLD